MEKKTGNDNEGKDNGTALRYLIPLSVGRRMIWKEE